MLSNEAENSRNYLRTGGSSAASCSCFGDGNNSIRPAAPIVTAQGVADALQRFDVAGSQVPPVGHSA